MSVIRVHAEPADAVIFPRLSCYLPRAGSPPYFLGESRVTVGIKSKQPFSGEVYNVTCVEAGGEPLTAGGPGVSPAYFPKPPCY